MENALDSVLKAIRARSDLIIRYESPRTLPPAEIRTRELHGLLELLWLLDETGVEVPGVIDGFVRAEIDRLKN